MEANVLMKPGMTVWYPYKSIHIPMYVKERTLHGLWLCVWYNGSKFVEEEFDKEHLTSIKPYSDHSEFQYRITENKNLEADKAMKNEEID